jgi:hypothetical protein
MGANAEDGDEEYDEDINTYVECHFCYEVTVNPESQRCPGCRHRFFTSPP